MSESETPIDQNTTGGEPLPVNEEENDIEVARLASSQANINEDDDDDNEEEEDDDEDDEDDEEEDEDDDDEDEEEDFMSELPKCVRHRVEKMKELNSKRIAIMEDYHRMMHVLLFSALPFNRFTSY